MSRRFLKLGSTAAAIVVLLAGAVHLGRASGGLVLVSILSPASGATLSGTVDVDVDASATYGIYSVQLLVDGQKTGAPDRTQVSLYHYIIPLDTKALANGSHSLSILATDWSVNPPLAGKQAVSAPVHVRVANAVAAPPGHGRVYPWHTNVVGTTFWVGEIFNGSIADGSQVCSAYDDEWAYHWSGKKTGTAGPGTDCAGAATGGCDGIPSGSGASFQCSTEARTAANGFFPTSPLVHPRENPFYLDLPFDDVNDPTAFAERCRVIPWAGDPGYSGRCSDANFSYMKNRWVRIVGPNGHACYGQIEDAGPSHDDLYHDAAYVFGSSEARPVQGEFNDAGMDVSPALNGCLGFAQLDGDTDRISWQFVDAADVPAGPWVRIVTKRPYYGTHNHS